MKSNILEVSRVTDTIDLEAFEKAVNVYIDAFGRPPYSEMFSPQEAYEALKYILDNKGDLILAFEQGGVVGLAGGYIRTDGSYYLEELAVDPQKQGLGIGRSLLQKLIDLAMAKKPEYLELRTTNTNNKAIKLYESEGFVATSSEVVPQTRQNGTIKLDERIRMQKPPQNPELKSTSDLRRIAVAYPSGNTTAIVFDQQLDADRTTLNSQIMQTWSSLYPDKPEIEQCCFVTLPSDQNSIARVVMFGDEFCGNATRSAIWIITKGRDYQGTIEVSGAQNPLEFSVSGADVSLEIPLPANTKRVDKVKEGSVVQLDGIAQLVVTDPNIQNKQTARTLLNNLLANNQYNLNNMPAVGVTYFDPLTREAQFCVWVNTINTIFDETACGSGTSAIAIALSNDKCTDVNIEVVQPSGEIIVGKAKYDSASKRVDKSYISGEVSILYDGQMELK